MTATPSTPSTQATLNAMSRAIRKVYENAALRDESVYVQHGGKMGYVPAKQMLAEWEEPTIAKPVAIISASPPTK